MSRPLLVMVPGLIGGLEYFDPATRVLGAQVHTIDLLGYGSCRDADPGRLTLDEQVGHVVDRIERLTAKPVWLLGHSMGGAVVMLLADRRPELIAGIINVEGNFTLKDAFWSRAIAEESLAGWIERFRTMRRDVPAWLLACGVEPTSQCVQWATAILDHQPANTLHAMSRSLVEQTGAPAYRETIRRVIERSIPLHLIAGVRSAADWDVPDFVRDAARSYTKIAGTGHLMMLEDPDGFCRAVDVIVTGT